MSDSRPEQLIQAENLYYNGRVEEALELIKNFEEGSELTQKDQLSAALLKGIIYCLRHEFKKVSEISEFTYSKSQELGLVPESIEALNLKSQIFWSGNVAEAFNLILKAEKLLNSLTDELPATFNKLKLNLMYMKSYMANNPTYHKNALEFAKETLKLAENIKNNVYVGWSLVALGEINFQGKWDLDLALEYLIKSLKHFETINFQVGIAYSFQAIGSISYYKGDLNNAIELCIKSLSIEKSSDFTKVQALALLGSIHMSKGELNKALKYNKKSTKLAEESRWYLFLIVNKIFSGEIYRKKGEDEKAEKHFEQVLVLSEQIGLAHLMVLPLLSLLRIKLDNNSRDQAQHYLKRLEKLLDQNKIPIVKRGCSIGKAMMLKTSSRMADHTDAARLLKEIVENDIISPQFHTLAIILLSELLLEELSIYNNLDIFEEINALISQLLKIAEENNSFSLLSETYLLQGRVALIKLNLDDARQNLTKAQKIADKHDLTLLARKISHEHDILVEELETWQNYKKTQISMSKRIQLASIDGVINRIQEKRAIDPPELVDEQSTLLLIIAEGGVLIFSYPFTEEWKQDETLFSSFLSAFTSFSDEFFSEGLDRAKFGQQTVLLESIGSYSVCYLYKGQTYAAKQKISKFTEAIQNNTSIWPILEKVYKTSQVLEIKDSPFLEHLITNIFVK
ncbi:MAG: tetratricopeptide repeat protein [Promethearchaeota archaeon]|jgi:tetratricopeptide (TPR) repeat protein